MNALTGKQQHKYDLQVGCFALQDGWNMNYNIAINWDLQGFSHMKGMVS